ncbi:MAG: toll/interleukin-1 receptor domain-containing protein [Pseudomonadota bacterium]
MASTSSTPRVFISYRRSGAAGHAGRLFDRLRDRRFGQNLFMDVANIEPGEVFERAIEARIAHSNIMLVVIDPTWVECRDGSDQRRLDNPDDYVRIEVQLGLDAELTIVPVLVGGAQMPRANDLPSALRGLSGRNAFSLTDAHFHRDVEALASWIEGLQESRIASEPRFHSIRVQVHEACFLDKPDTICYFVNVVNRAAVDIELTHVWYEAKTRVDLLNAARPLPRRLRPSESWETWIEATRIGDDEQVATNFFVRLSTGEICGSQANESVPRQGYVPGGGARPR